MVWHLESFSNDSVVVDLAIDRERNALILVGEWLCSTVDSHNTQTLMSKDYSGLAMYWSLCAHCLLVELAT